DNFTYNNDNELITSQGPFGGTVTITRDEEGNAIKMQDGFGNSTTATYDGDNRLLNRQINSALRVEYQYLSAGEVQEIDRFYYNSGTKTSASKALFTYDLGDRLTNLTQKDGSGPVLENFTYTYDAGDRLTSDITNGTTTSYGYDNADQLTSAGAVTYGYDN